MKSKQLFVVADWSKMKAVHPDVSIEGSNIQALLELAAVEAKSTQPLLGHF